MLGCIKENIRQHSEYLEVPEKISAALTSEFPAIGNVSWEKEGAFYEASYVENNYEKSLLYDAAGQVVGRETELPISELPHKIKDYLSTNYPDFEIEEYEKEEWSDRTVFDVEIRTDDREIELTFDQDLNFIGEEVEDEKEEDVH